MSKYVVSKCICHNRAFSEIKEYAGEQGYSTVEELQSDKYCSCSCGLCIPYIQMMFETGRTEFAPGEFYKMNIR